MGDFNNVHMGIGALSINGVDVGFLKGNVNYKYNYDIAEFKTGVPRMLQGSICKEIFAELTAPLAEITPTTLGHVLGGLTSSATTAAEVDLTGAFVEFTFADCPYAPVFESIYIGIPGYPSSPVTITAASVIIKDLTEVKTYTENTDYIVDYATGMVYRNPGGSIGSGATVKVKRKYTPSAYHQIDLGYTFAIADVELNFVHTNPTTGKYINVHMWKANASGNAEFSFDEENWAIINCTFKAVYDSTHPTTPLGYIQFED